MKVFVLHPITESFRTKTGGWSVRLENAIGFETSSEAIEYCDKSVADVSQVILALGGFSEARRSTVRLRESVPAESSGAAWAKAFAESASEAPAV